MIEFNAGEFIGDVTLEKVTTYRDGDVKVQVRVKNGKGGMLLDNVNHICQAKFEIEGMTITTQGELVHLGTYRNGETGIDLIVPNDINAQKLLSKAKESGTAVINFSSAKATPPSDPEDGQPNLGGLGDD